jgi:ElaB/YqjD/DUF883 family membrane-anchored ribosome-binding protein
MEREEEIAEEIATLRADINRMKEDLESALSSAGSLSKEKLQDTKQRLMAAMDNLQKRIREGVTTAYTGAYAKGKEAVDMSRQKIVENPFYAVGGAFLAGAALAILLGRCCHGRND